MKQHHYFLVFLCLSLSSCVSYQYVTLDSRQSVNPANEFVTENDTLVIKYNFAGRNGPITIHVYNKSAKPIYVDWKKSALIIDGRKYDYWQEVSHFDGSGSTSLLNPSSYSYTDVSGTAVKDERITFIPPRSYIESNRMQLQNFFFKDLPVSRRKKAMVPAGSGQISAIQYAFTPEDTPLQFRSLVTVSTTVSFSEETYYESSFWVSEIIESENGNIYSLPAAMQPNKNASRYLPPNGNRFRVEGASGAGSALAGSFLGSLLLLALVMLAAR